MIGNVHFLAIPINATAKAAAQVFANFLLSPLAQAKKADIREWGDGTVLDMEKLPEQARKLFQSRPIQGLVKPVPTLPELHTSWVKAIEDEWQKRYGAP
jgi:putative thiamine transport system substrate-binding protein